MTGFWRGWVAIGMGLALAAASPVMAQSIPAADWKSFLDQSYSQYGDPEPDDWEDQLYAAASKAKSQDAAIADFAGRIHADRDKAEDYARLIIDVVNYSHGCEEHTCAFGPGVPVYGETARVAVTEPTGKLLLTVAGDVENLGPDNFFRLVWRHPAAVDIFFKLYTSDGDTSELAAALMRLPDDPSAVEAPFVDDESAWRATPDEESGLVSAAIDAAEARLAVTPGTLAWRASLAGHAVQRELWLGMDHDAVARYHAYPQEVRDAMLDGVTCDQNQFRTRLAAALWLEGAHDEASTLVACQAPDSLVRDAMVPAIADKDLFDRFVGDNGLLSGTSGDTPAVRAVVTQRLATAGYKDMAAWLASNAAYYGGDRDAPVLTKLGDLIPAEVSARAPAWADRIAAARAAQKQTADAASTIHVTMTQLAPAWTEKPLPQGVAAWKGGDGGPDDEVTGPRLPKGVKLPVPADSVLRYEASGKDAAIIHASSDYDLSGEIPAAGLWLDLRRDGVWQKPLYLGLQEHFPYVVTPESKLPLINGDHLNLEVEVREIDKATITFPPVGLGYSRQADGLYLDMPLAALSADSDGDGLTDIEEARLGLKRDSADSDGDGIADGDDPLPLTAYDAKADARMSAVAKLILTRLIGHDAGALVVEPVSGKGDDDILHAVGHMGPQGRRDTIFVVSDRDIFSGVAAAPFRLIVYSPADVARLNRDAPFFPPQVTQLFASLDGNDYFVAWSAGWVGGSLTIHCDGNDCTAKDAGNWIT